jgi:hypothetical protein
MNILPQFLDKNYSLLARRKKDDLFEQVRKQSMSKLKLSLKSSYGLRDCSRSQRKMYTFGNSIRARTSSSYDSSLLMLLI